MGVQQGLVDIYADVKKIIFLEVWVVGSMGMELLVVVAGWKCSGDQLLWCIGVGGGEEDGGGDGGLRS